MLRTGGGRLAVAVVMLCTGCIVYATPVPPTAALVTATAAATDSPAPATPTAISIITATEPSVPASPPAGPATPTPANSTATAPATVAVTSLAPSSPTVAPALPSSTPLAVASSAATGTAMTITPPPATVPAAASATAAATAQPVGILSFAISPQTINPGDSVTLSWQATGAQATLYRVEPGGPLTDMQSVPLSGTLTLKVDAGLRNRVDYALFAGAGSSFASATVSAVIRCPDKYFFANPPAGCPSWGPSPEPMASEHFQHGVMLWLSGQNDIYLLFGDGGQPGWATAPNQWVAGQAESDPSIVPPPGLYQPVRGFGVAWRGSDYAGGPSMRDRLGWATDAETALTGDFQCDSADKYTNCYISGPGGLVYWLKPEFSSWQVWTGP